MTLSQNPEIKMKGKAKEENLNLKVGEIEKNKCKDTLQQITLA